MHLVFLVLKVLSLSARRAWIEIFIGIAVDLMRWVALRKESVDRNIGVIQIVLNDRTSLSARRAWIEIIWHKSQKQN